MLMEDDFFVFFYFCQLGRHMSRYWCHLRWHDDSFIIYCFLLYFNCFSHVYVLFDHVLPWFPPVSLCLFMFDHVPPLMVARFIMFSSLFPPVDHCYPPDLPCYPLLITFSCCPPLSFPCLSPVFLPDDFVSSLSSWFPPRYPDEDRDDFMICLIWWLFKAVC